MTQRHNRSFIAFQNYLPMVIKKKYMSKHLIIESTYLNDIDLSRIDNWQIMFVQKTRQQIVMPSEFPCQTALTKQKEGSRCTIKLKILSQKQIMMKHNFAKVKTKNPTENSKELNDPFIWDILYTYIRPSLKQKPIRRADLRPQWVRIAKKVPKLNSSLQQRSFCEPGDAG